MPLLRGNWKPVLQSPCHLEDKMEASLGPFGSCLRFTCSASYGHTVFLQALGTTQVPKLLFTIFKTHHTVQTWNSCLISCLLGECYLLFMSQLKCSNFCEGKFPWFFTNSPCIVCTLLGHCISCNNPYLFLHSNEGKCSDPSWEHLLDDWKVFHI